jgi:hypothetical protein
MRSKAPVIAVETGCVDDDVEFVLGVAGLDAGPG